ncbi:hypothetical protein OG795_15320 [[Kitasatospora] papulosa]|uniref:hypothetical protein n=1 Tax=[Kitasatospora] papulosa TaxID=1464011 RepID=UPI0032463C63
MNRIPDAVAVASLETHRLIVTVPNDGPAEISSNLPGPVAASVLRQIAAHVERPGRCATAVATGRPCPVHDTPAPPRPTGLDDLLATVADQLPQDDPDRAARGLADMTTPADRHPADDEEQRQHPNPFAVDPEQVQRAQQQLGEAFTAFGRKLRAALERSAVNLAALDDQPTDEPAVEEQPTEEPAPPAEGDRYVKRAAPDEGRVVTVERVWKAADGHTAVAYKWHDPRASYAGSACPLDVFRRTYRPATAPAAE